MTAFVTLYSAAFRTPDGRTLFDNLTLAFGPERTALVGRNGAGKTSLIRLILGEFTPAAGTVTRNGRIAVLRQALAPPPGASVADLLGVAEDLARLSRIEAGDGGEDDLAAADWMLPDRLQSELARVGLRGLDLARPAAGLSGGEATRAALAGVLLAEPDLIVMDEPTNNLDAEARGIVAETLARWRGGAILASHDRALLRQVDRIVEITGLGVRVYGGGYDLYEARKADEEAAAARDLAGAERAAASVAREAQAAREKKSRRDAGGRRYAASGSAPKIILGMMAERAESSGGREQRLAEKQTQAAGEALAEAQGRVERLRRLAFELPPSGLPAGRRVLTLDEVTFGHPGRPPVIDRLSLQMTGPERLALCGPNGSGKSTLVRLILGELTPQSGKVSLEVRPVALDQHTAVLRAEETLAQAYRRLNPGAGENAARAALARFLFRNTAADAPVGGLSGGERLRAALACTLDRPAPPQLLILDEPTNHLDLDAIAALEAALRGYDGALIVISHDDAFLQAVGVQRRLSLPPG